MAIRAPLLERLLELRLISQRSVYPHIDIDACTRLGVIVSFDEHASTLFYATSAQALHLGSRAGRGDASDLPADVRRSLSKAGRWQLGAGRSLRRKRLGLHGYGRIGAVVAGYGKVFRHAGLGAGAGRLARPRAGRRLRGGLPARRIPSRSAT